MAGHAQLKFVMTECSKTQIRLTGPVLLVNTLFPAANGQLSVAKYNSKINYNLVIKNRRGVITLKNNNFEQKVQKVNVDKNGNYVILDITVQDKRFTLVNLYGPNQDNPNFYTNLLQNMEEFEHDQIIMCGDWNHILNSDLDCENYIHINNPNARRVILNYMDEESLLVAWRIMNENVKKFAWRRLNPVRK